MNGNLQHFDYERELADATAAMELAFEHWKCPELSVATRILWNPRFTSRAGDAMYAPCGCSRIRLSAPLWPHFPEVDRYETVIHEAAHIAAPYLVLKGDPGRRHPLRIGHGIEWKRLMWRAGLEAKRCHTLDIDKLGLRRRPMQRDQYWFSCRCPDGVRVGPVVAKRILRNTRSYSCRRCQTPILKQGLRQETHLT